MQPCIVERILEAKKRKIKVSPQHVNRASSAGHPCLFYLYASRVHWRERLPHDVFTQLIFEAGQTIEQKVIEDMREAGIVIIEQQKAWEMKYLQLTGHIDGKILVDGTAYPIEIKSLSPYEWERLNCIEDFLMSKRAWIKSYPAQLTLYMLAENVEYGCLYLVNKVNWKPKEIWISLDYTYAEQILKNLEIVNKAIETNTPPPKLNDPDICRYCGFVHICLPEMVGSEIQVIDDRELEEVLTRVEQLKPLVKEYNQLDKKWRQAVEGKEKIIIGDYIITGKWVERGGYTVEPTKYWQAKVIVKPKDEVKGEDA